MNLLMNMLSANVWGFFRDIFAKQSLNPNKTSGMNSWVMSETSDNKPTLPSVSSRDRSLPLPLRLEALQPELEQFDRALPYAHFNEVADVTK